jgi:hypothetical protein
MANLEAVYFLKLFECHIRSLIQGLEITDSVSTLKHKTGKFGKKEKFP